MVTALYARVSTDAQAEEGYSIDIQGERLEAYCKLKGYKSFEHYVDGGYTGSNLNRPAMTRLIEDCKCGEVERVVVFKLDRLSRSQKDTLYLIEEVFLPHNVDFVSISESFDTATPFGRAMIGILSVFAQLERENIKERTKAGMLGRVREGYWPGGGRTPFGYDYDPKLKTLVPNKDAETVRKIYDLYIGGCSTYEIQRILGMKYDRLAEQILARKTNTGIIVYNGVEYQGKHEPIVSLETYERAMACMKKRSATPTPRNNVYLLTGLLVCGVCGAKMRYQGGHIYCYSRQKSKAYLVKDPNCNNESHNVQDIENAVLTIFFQNTSRFNKAEAYDIKTNVLDELVQQKKALEQKIRRLYGLYGDGGDDYLIETIEESKQQLARIADKITNEEDREKEEIKKRQLVEKVSNIRDRWGSMSPEEQREVLHEAIKQITITHNKINIDFNL